MRRSRRPRRPGVTLLETLLAAALASLLMAGLYAASDMILLRSSVERQRLDNEELLSQISHRIQSDLTGITGIPQPKSDPGAATSAAKILAVPPQSGLMGGPNSLTLYPNRNPRSLRKRETNLDQSKPTDLFRVTYSVTEGVGLRRKESARTSIDDPLAVDDSGETIAQEVKAIQFEYYDGSEWLTEWNGSETSGSTVVGPPLAIRVTLHTVLPTRRGEEERVISFVAVVPNASGSSASSTLLSTSGAAP